MKNTIKLRKTFVVMDVRAFGSVYGQSSTLPYASGFHYVPASGLKRFSAARGFYFMTDAGQDHYLTVEMTDTPGQQIPLVRLNADSIVPMSITAIHSGTVHNVIVFY